MKMKLILFIILIGIIPLVSAEQLETIHADKYEWQVTYSNDKDYEIYIHDKDTINTLICLYNPKINLIGSFFMPLEKNIYRESNELIGAVGKNLIDKEVIKTEKDYYGYCFVNYYENEYLRFGEKSTIIEWIKIVKASHLNSTRVFIEDVFDYVQARDYNYTEINETHYLRITFETNLTAIRDITIYAKSMGKESSIEVYEKDNETMLTKFESITKDGDYQVFLNNLTGEQDTFDLKVLGSPVEFDYIVDPTNDYYVDDLDDYTTQWNEVGIDPYLNTTIATEEDWRDYIWTDVKNEEHGDFSFPSLPENATSINSVTMIVYAICVGGNIKQSVDVWDSGASSYISHNYLCPVPDIGDWVSVSLPELTTVDEVNNAKFHARSRSKDPTSGAVILLTAFLRVDYNLPCYSFHDGVLRIPPTCDRLNKDEDIILEEEVF